MTLDTKIHFGVGVVTWTFLQVSSFMYVKKGGELSRKHWSQTIQDFLVLTIVGWASLFFVLASLLKKDLRDFFYKAWF